MMALRDRQVLACSDWTTLTFEEQESDLARMLDLAEALEGGPAACCIPLKWVGWWSDRRTREGIALATVLNFPYGAASTAAVAAEVEDAAPAEEWDVVFPHEAFRSGDDGPARELMPLIRQWAGTRTVKVILETGAPWEPRRLQRAAEWCLESGADFLKTSTGKVPIGASPEAVDALLEVLRGTGKGLKVSGGIRTIESAHAYLDQVEEVMGFEFINPQTFRLGTSNLLIR
jgi:deoxyribose-phosphate aldolase